MITKKIGAVVLSGALVVSALPSPFLLKADADSYLAKNSVQTIAAKEQASSSASSEDLENMINTVKGKITIPSELSEFSYNYYSGNPYSDNTWNFTWSSKDGSKNIYVNSDSKGHISSYNYYTNQNYKPVYLQGELKDKADAFIKGIAPDISGKLQYLETSSASPYSGTYTYQYQRVENGIPMPDNSVSVSVNYQTGDVTSYNANWLYDVTIPSSTVKISKEDAAATIGKNIKMTLSYQSAYAIYNSDNGNKNNTKAFLVYSPDKSYLAVDAITGKLYDTQSIWYNLNGAAETAKDSGAKSMALKASGLTPQESAEVDNIKGLITKNDAIQAVKSNTKLLFDKNMTSVSANLYKNNYADGNSGYIWNINFSDPREIKDSTKDSYRAYASATVDAKTGKIIGYYSSTNNYYNSKTGNWETPKVKYTSKQGKGILESFLKEQIPEYFKSSTYTGTSDDYVIAYKDSKPVYGGYSYNYQRVNEGISYAANNISGAVDGVTGKIYSFGYSWDSKVTFEAPTNVISADKAFGYYIANEGYRLVYEIYYKNSVSDTKTDASYTQTPLVRLVYRTDISPDFISPFTGKQLDYDGKEYVKQTTLYSYTDIEGNSSARNIKLLANMGIGFEGGLFKPAQAVTSDELKDFIQKAGFYADSSKYKLTGNTVSRIDAAKYAIQVLGLEKAAKITGIYSMNVTDQSSISQSDLGYAAIAYGLKLLLPNNNSQLHSGDNLTRQDTADLIAAMLNTQE
ncbi:YcdB/YcdC domain-containing protein [Anaerocolumna xylanovorans]|uniref:YcdB/YcdC repeated domain-containing protein n=1 Tax=Anaerocolumna xylanovorans DSM 12503 TaxID=1121345 RepID=A0A1M7Y0V2_9FIRM|nr:YcdB/YcdC domain-containing protein [Anaerocolumna xylanovorans]SHO45119.1 hypothetical protein SAMN02745217_00832 [Anaerocolumna xylanovorans DSM 12503]